MRGFIAQKLTAQTSLNNMRHLLQSLDNSMQVKWQSHREKLRIKLSFAWRMHKCKLATKLRKKAEKIKKDLGKSMSKKVVRKIGQNT